jgi:hypothetical protein
MAESDEFAEFETDEATFDAMLEQAEPAELVPPPACVTVLSAVRDAVTFRHGLPLSIGNTASTAVSGPIQQSPIRPHPIRQEQPILGVAG